MSNFEILTCVPGGELIGKDPSITPTTYKLSANTDFRGKDGTFTLPAVTLERIVAGRELSIIGKQLGDKPRDIWVRGEVSSTEEPLTAEQLNTALDESEKPRVRIMESDQYPSLLTVHRSVAIGSVALSVVRRSETIQSARIVRTGNMSFDFPYSVYTQDTLLMAVADPATTPEMSHAVADLERILTA
jgi:hypothetical protein